MLRSHTREILLQPLLSVEKTHLFYSKAQTEQKYAIWYTVAAIYGQKVILVVLKKSP